PWTFEDRTHYASRQKLVWPTRPSEQKGGEAEQMPGPALNSGALHLGQAPRLRPGRVVLCHASVPLWAASDRRPNGRGPAGAAGLFAPYPTKHHPRDWTFTIRGRDRGVLHQQQSKGAGRLLLQRRDVTSFRASSGGRQRQPRVFPKAAAPS